MLHPDHAERGGATSAAADGGRRSGGRAAARGAKSFIFVASDNVAAYKRRRHVPRTSEGG